MLQLNQFFTFITAASYECRFYKILKDGDCSVDSKVNKGICDYNVDFNSWYRFMGAAGTQLSTSCVPRNRCGTSFPLWMDDEYPTEDEGRVKRRVCQSWNGCCRWNTKVSVRNCGGFYVHKFSPPPKYSGRYCGYSPKGESQNSTGNNKLSNLLCDDIDNAYYFVGSRATRNERKYYFNLKVKVNCFLRKVCVQLFKIKASFWLAC